jgi:hypothetical protein
MILLIIKVVKKLKVKLLVKDESEEDMGIISLGMKRTSSFYGKWKGEEEDDGVSTGEGKTCTGCGETNPLEAKFCASCGHQQ